MLMLKIRQLIFVVKLHNQEQIDCSPAFRGVDAISRNFHIISSYLLALSQNLLRHYATGVESTRN